MSCSADLCNLAMQGQAVPKLIGFGIIKAKGLAFMATELLGSSLSELPHQEVSRHAPQAEAALAQFQSLGILHGDAHPGNCLLREKGTQLSEVHSSVALIDFSHSLMTPSSPAVLSSEVASFQEALVKLQRAPNSRRAGPISRRSQSALSCRILQPPLQHARPKLCLAACRLARKCMC